MQWHWHDCSHLGLANGKRFFFFSRWETSWELKTLHSRTAMKIVCRIWHTGVRTKNLLIWFCKLTLFQENCFGLFFKVLCVISDIITFNFIWNSEMFCWTELVLEACVRFQKFALIELFYFFFPFWFLIEVTHLLKDFKFQVRLLYQ